ncbi:MAG: hypothetical protein KDK91_31280, partial [Gammaproteobacteria bacterium]|nr:hypothetical protein [Gammaproteobacteria bacterium]
FAAFSGPWIQHRIDTMGVCSQMTWDEHTLWHSRTNGTVRTGRRVLMAGRGIGERHSAESGNSAGKACGRIQ